MKTIQQQAQELAEKCARICIQSALSQQPIISMGPIRDIILKELNLEQLLADKEGMEYLEKQFGCGLINDDNGHWALSWGGMQNVVVGKAPSDLETTFFIEAGEFSDSARLAIDKAMKSGGSNE